MTRVEEVLGIVAPLGELIIDFPRPRTFSLKALLFDVAINYVEFLNEGIKLLLLLSRASFAGEDPRLALALVLLFLVGGSSSPYHSLSVVVLPQSRPFLLP